ncbi:MAG: protein kinase [Comamonadaceae bacterium]|nr:MAG: protein kinase [Comamonadaceae bacterium]
MSEATLTALRAGQLQGVTRLDLSCGLREFPSEIFALADTLQVLNLSGNALSELPGDLHRLKQLRIIFASDNAFTELPRALGRCPQLEMVGFKSNRIAHVRADALPPRLRWLILTDNAITVLPDALGNCTRLQKLMLAGNALTALPDSLARSEALELLRLAANRFEALPTWLPALPRLAWLAVAGNPLTAAREEQARHAAAVPSVDWARLRFGAVLGEGASGVIHAAQWQREDGPLEPVAVKIFKGGVTSDGWPTSEMAASLMAGQHPHLIGLRGRLTRHPEGREGLVLQRIGADWQPLAGPPSFATCTRDVYAPGTAFDAATVRQLAADVAAAMAHLHAQGLVHGDLYAHNVLWRPGSDGAIGRALLGDFGAAACPPEALQPALRALDVRAFGWLLDELLAHGPINAVEDLRDIRALRDDCLYTTPAARPAFAAMLARMDRSLAH